MARILVIDLLGGVCASVEGPLREAGWEVVFSDDPMASCATSTDAIVLATDMAGLAQAQHHMATVREQAAIPVVLIASLDRSGWDRAFGTPEALGVDALFDTPVDGHALVQRLVGILASREDAHQCAAASDMASILQRAIANEEAAAAFYRRAAERVTNPDTRQVLELLMREEEDHKRIVQEFRNGARPLPSGPAQNATLAEALGAPQFGTGLSTADAFLLAANKERLAMEFYANWAHMYPDGDERRLLLQLSEVERGHKALVESMFTNAAFPEAW